jgi:hypothetical protein
MEVAIVGGGITGLSLALNLHNRGIACRRPTRPAQIPTRRRMTPKSRGLGGLWIIGRNCKVQSATRGDIALMSPSISIAAEGSAGSHGRKT